MKIMGDREMGQSFYSVLHYIIFTYEDCLFLRCWSSITRGESRRLEFKGILHPQSSRQNHSPVSCSLVSQAGLSLPAAIYPVFHQSISSLWSASCQHSLPSIHFCCPPDPCLDPEFFAPRFAYNWHSIKGREWNTRKQQTCFCFRKFVSF